MNNRIYFNHVLFKNLLLSIQYLLFIHNNKNIPYLIYDLKVFIQIYFYKYYTIFSLLYYYLRTQRVHNRIYLFHEL